MASYRTLPPSRPAVRRGPTLDISATLDRLEDELRTGAPLVRRKQILAIVGRWRWDPMFRDACQRRSRALFDSYRADH